LPTWVSIIFPGSYCYENGCGHFPRQKALLKNPLPLTRILSVLFVFFVVKILLGLHDSALFHSKRRGCGGAMNIKKYLELP
jgi:hypothetical protein